MAFNPDIPQPKKVAQEDLPSETSFEDGKNQEVPKDWMSVRGISEKLDRSKSYVEQKIKEFFESNSEVDEYRKKFLNGNNMPTSFYSSEVFDYIQRQVIERAPDGWMNAGQIASLTGRDYGVIYRLIKKYEEIHGNLDKFSGEFSAQGKVSTVFYTPEVVEFIVTGIKNWEEISKPPEGWISARNFREKLGIAGTTVEKYIDEFFGSGHNDSFRGEFQIKGGRSTIFYAPEFGDFIQNKLKTFENIPPRWLSFTEIAKHTGRSTRMLKPYIESTTKDMEGSFGLYRRKDGKVVMAYSPEVFELVIKKLSELRTEVPKGWITQAQINRVFNITDSSSKKYIAEFLASVQNTESYAQNFFFKNGEKTCYSAEVVDFIRERLETDEIPEGWMYPSQISQDLDINNPGLVSRYINEFFQSNLQEKSFVREGRNPRGMRSFFYSPQVVEFIKKKSEGLQPAPEGWMHSTSIAKMTGVTAQGIEKAIREVFSAEEELKISEHREVYRSEGGRSYYYSPVVVQKIVEQAKERRHIPAVPNGWESIKALSKAFSSAESTIQRKIDDFFLTHEKGLRYAGVFRASKNGRYGEYYSPEVIEFVQDNLGQKAPTGWLLAKKIADRERVDISKVNRLLKDFFQDREKSSEYTKEFRSKMGKMLDHYSPEVADFIHQEISKVGLPPDGWMTLGEMAESFGVGVDFIKSLMQDSELGLTSDDRGFFAKAGVRKSQYYSQDVVRLIGDKVDKIKLAPDHWMSLQDIVQGVEASERPIRKFIEDFLKNKEDVQQYTGEFRSVRGRVFQFYSPEVMHFVSDRVQEFSKAPEGWQTSKSLEQSRNVSRKLIQKTFEEYPVSEQASKLYKDVSGRVNLHYSPEFIEHLLKKIENFQEPPNGWMTSEDIQKKLILAYGTVKRLIAEYYTLNEESEKNTGLFRSRGRMDLRFYSPMVVEYINQRANKFETAPEGWITIPALCKTLGTHYQRVKDILDQFSEESPNVEVLNTYKNYSGRDSLHCSPEAVFYVKNYLETNSEDLLQKCETSFGDIEEIENLKQFISLFGPSLSLDILYALHPEHQGIPVEKVKSILAEYLGDYLLTPAPFSLENLKGAEALFGAPSLMEGLSEVIKRDALEKILAKRESGIEQNIALFREYFDNLRIEARNIGNTDLMETILTVEKFYISILNVTTPEGMVASLKEGREFPDIYQRINIREIETKKRLLIADEMGAGKSASAILAKEHLGVEIALVVVPSNAMDTWAGYLSDKVDEDGKQVGYFQEQPKVLQVTDIRQLEGVEKDKYDYIVISHERLTAEYTEALEQLDYGMLIVDEVHKLKNIETGVRAEHLLRLAENKEGEEKYVAMLSGTPVPNKVEDVAMLLKLMYPERFSETDSRSLTRSIIHGDLLDLRQLLLPRLQMKNLGEHIEMPTLTEQVSVVELTPSEEEIYQILLDEDELTPTEKMQMLQKFLLNPKLLDITPGVPSSKLEMLKGDLESAFEGKEKVVLFVNDYISNVIRGEDSILEGLSLPQDVEMRVIHGGVSSEERTAIQEEFQRGDKKMLLVVSGKTADVAVDYSAGQEIIFYNEPWTIADKHQQQARVYRPGIADDVESRTILTKGTIEEGKHEYIQVKHRAIEKLLRGIPITEIEMELLEKSEDAEKADLSVNPELAEYYFSSFEKMNRIFASVKEIGEKKFSSFLEKHGAEYADCYRELGSRSYQSNASRVVATVIEEMVQRQGVENPRILDLASGPEMLRRHSTSAQRANIVSLDINPEHFANKTPESETIVGSFTDIPLAPESVDYINLSLALHYTKLVPSKGEYERLEALREMSRVLKTSGRAVVNMIYSLDFLNEKTLTTIAKQFGLRVVDEYSGEVSGGAGYHSRIITFEKSAVTPESVEEVLGNLSKEDLNGLKLRRTDVALKDSRKVLSHFTLGGKEMQIRLNEEDETLAKEEASIFQEVEALKVVHGSVQEIPRETIIERGFVRIRTGKNKYILFKKIPGVGAVITR